MCLKLESWKLKTRNLLPFENVCEVRTFRGMSELCIKCQNSALNVRILRIKSKSEKSHKYVNVVRILTVFWQKFWKFVEVEICQNYMFKFEGKNSLKKLNVVPQKNSVKVRMRKEERSELKSIFTHGLILHVRWQNYTTTSIRWWMKKNFQEKFLGVLISF